MTTPTGRTVNIPPQSTRAELYVDGVKISATNPIPVSGTVGGGSSGAVTVANGADVAQGATTDVEATTNGSVIAILKRIRTLLGSTLATSRTWTLTSGADSVTVGNFPATQAVTGTVTDNQGTPNSVANAWPVKNSDGTNTAAVKAASTAAAATDPALTVALSPNSPVTQAALTKGTQGATGVSTQDLKDAGRTSVVLSATAATSIIAETVMSLNQYRAAAASTVTSYTVPAGKTFRVQAVQFGVRATTPSTTVTFGSARFNIRAGTLVTSPLVYGDSKQMQTNAATPNSDLAVPDGMEFPAGTVLSLWQTCSAVTMALDALIVGYEY